MRQGDDDLLGPSMDHTAVITDILLLILVYIYREHFWVAIFMCLCLRSSILKNVNTSVLYIIVPALHAHTFIYQLIAIYIHVYIEEKNRPVINFKYKIPPTTSYTSSSHYG